MYDSACGDTGTHELMFAGEGDLFVPARCPLCGADRCTVVREAQIPRDLTLQRLREACRASSALPFFGRLVRCGDCSLVYASPRVRDDILRAGYAASEDETFVRQNPERIRTYGRVFRQLRRRGLIAEGENQRLLDVGCAGGALLVAARACGLNPVGVEPSSWLAGHARRTYGLDVQQGWLEAGRFPDAAFDLVTLCDVIEHVVTPRELLSNVHAILKTGGRLIVTFPDYASWPARLLRGRWPFLLTVHLSYFTRATVATLINSSGFRIDAMFAHSPSLRLGYVLDRMRPYLALAPSLSRLAHLLRVADIPVRYSLGQTLVVARRV